MWLEAERRAEEITRGIRRRRHHTRSATTPALRGRCIDQVSSHVSLSLFMLTLPLPSSNSVFSPCHRVQNYGTWNLNQPIKHLSDQLIGASYPVCSHRSWPRVSPASRLCEYSAFGQPCIGLPLLCYRLLFCATVLLFNTKTSGVLGPAFYDLLQDIGRRVSQRSGDPRETAWLQQCINLAVVRVNAAAICGPWDGEGRP
ncbi:hypothetical protein O3P69_003281 [Scylla paramamosain]|uniref:Uncharacterized protein n=1 Tax=Scylla paramamosain TaxID=85552 RepID=A0AAW0UMS7_SCYPA